MNPRFLSRICTLAVSLAVCCVCTPAHAGPGGEIASAAFRTPVGRVVMAALVILLSPYLIYVAIKEAKAVKLTLRDLQSLAAKHPEFDWLTLKERVSEAFHRVHAAWRKEDMSEASQWMTDWYWQNQQMVFLEQWERDGLVNHCRVRSIKKIRPLFVRYRTVDGVLDGSRLVVSITADMEDYLAERLGGKVVQGKPGYVSVERVWTFLLDKGRWRVSNIESGAVSLAYAKLLNEVPQALIDAARPAAPASRAAPR